MRHLVLKNRNAESSASTPTLAGKLPDGVRYDCCAQDPQRACFGMMGFVASARLRADRRVSGKITLWSWRRDLNP